VHAPLTEATGSATPHEPTRRAFSAGRVPWSGRACPGPSLLSLGLVVSSVRVRPFPLEVEGVALLAVGALALTGLFGLLRAALLHSVPSRVLEIARGESRRKRLRPLLERAESLATSASVYWITSQILFVVFVWVLVGEVLGGEGLSTSSMGLSLVITVPLLVIAGEVLPSALRGQRSDRFLTRALLPFDLAQRPLAALIVGLEAVRSVLMRVLRIQARPASTREIVEGLRAVIEDSEREKELAASEREIIENALAFHDVDVAQVMTPRTEIHAVERSEGVAAVVRVIAETGHSRVPVYDGNLDRIVGVAYAQEILQAIARGEMEGRDLGSIVRTVLFVPETKLASELLAGFRRNQQKVAIVLDEYGGTSGLVTMGDIVTELVGDMPGELGRRAPEPVTRLAEGRFEVLGTTRVSDLNHELGLDLPEEEDFETLAGFVLAELGRFPHKGEQFERAGVLFAVVEATDRRVIKIEVRLPLAAGTGPTHS
jgi:CBS domain containing-hemolysin-like protein